MKKRKYHMNIGATETCMKSVIEETKELGQRVIKGATGYFFSLDLPQRGLLKLLCMVFLKLFVCIKLIQNHSVSMPLRI